MLRLSSRVRRTSSQLSKSRGSLDPETAVKDDVKDELDDAPRAGRVRLIAESGGNGDDVVALAMQLRTKGYVVLPDAPPKYWLRHASRRAGLALQKAKACNNGYYDICLAQDGSTALNSSDKTMQERWEPLISACCPAHNGGQAVWFLDKHGLLATTAGAQAPWPQRPETITAAEAAASLVAGLKHEKSHVECVHVIIPLTAMKAQVGAVGAAALDLRAGDILVINDSHPHFGFGRSTKTCAKPFLYWTYARRSSAALAWEPQTKEALFGKQVSHKQTQQEETAKQFLSLSAMAVPYSCRNSFSKLQAEKEGKVRPFSDLGVTTDLNTEKSKQLPATVVEIDESSILKDERPNGSVSPLMRPNSLQPMPLQFCQ
eukprot:gnl/MRDRNA2_/MRDRNA2_201945_c0_seq1.p1 gnl/MRDRNA2_/MRDRNA2_201945_c0~~gnl/MRDRNA2_/MRDRNA2_201945_c0_seq1.p1  ORF type:complete len:374 (+),score=61.98 gnl/MRDRNA2_/MRDRNA2_201945_c0_seq1:78-1199(+)